MKDNTRKCAKCNLSTAQAPGLTLHRFPKPGPFNSKRTEAWAQFCYPDQQWFSSEFQNKLYTNHKMLCSQHFPKSQFVKDHLQRDKLHRYAVPSENLWDKPSIQPLDTTNPNQTMHGFPNPKHDIKRFNEWVALIGGDIISLDNEHIYKRRTICHAHFESKYWCRNNRISNIAVPTLKMPGPLSKFSMQQAIPKRHNEPKIKQQIYKELSIFESAGISEICMDHLADHNYWQDKRIVDHYKSLELLKVCTRSLESKDSTAKEGNSKVKEDLSKTNKNDYDYATINSKTDKSSENIKLVRRFKTKYDDILLKEKTENVPEDDTEEEDIIAKKNYEDFGTMKLTDFDETTDINQEETSAENYEDFDAMKLIDFYDTHDIQEEMCTEQTIQEQPKTVDQENFVLHHQDFLKDKLKSILHSHRFCAVCFESNNSLKSLDEELIIICDNWTQTILLKHVYTYVFKQTETSASGYICTECTTQLQQAYIFIKYSQLTSSLLNEYIDDAQSKIGKVQDLHEGKDNDTTIILESNEIKKYLINQTVEKEIIVKMDMSSEIDEWDYENIESQLTEIIREHLKAKPKPIPKICELCSKETLHLENHYARLHSLVTCKVCNIHVNEENIKQHMIEKHKNIVYICDLCDNPFYTLLRLQYHSKIIHNINEKSVLKPKKKEFPKYVKETLDYVKLSKCSECSETPCIHRKYLDIYVDQTLNHSFIFAKCADCDFACRSKEELVRHVNKVHLKHSPHICDQCGGQFFCKKSLSNHIKIYHQTKNVYICKYCDQQFESSDIVSNHETSCSSIERAYRCEHCTASFNTYELLQKHHKLRHKEVFPCQYCNKEWLTEPMRNQHIARVHSGVRITSTNRHKFVCDICQEEFKLRDKLKQHFKDHGPDVKYQCKICNKEYISLQKLKAHNQSLRHNMPSVACNICGKQIKQVLLEQHLEEHKLDAEVSCDVCNRKFNNIARLRTHMECHLNPRKKKKQNRTQLKCQSCDYVTHLTAELERHINRTHLHIKPYGCRMCNKKFPGKNMLKKHEEVWHLPRKKIPCPICRREYYMKYIKNHIKLHSKENKYACKMCDQKFATNHKRYMHVLSKHSTKSVCCPLCNRKFSHLIYLRRHIIVVHWKDKSNDANRFDPREVEGLENHYHLFPRWLERQNQS